MQLKRNQRIRSNPYLQTLDPSKVKSLSKVPERLVGNTDHIYTNVRFVVRGPCISYELLRQARWHLETSTKRSDVPLMVGLLILLESKDNALTRIAAVLSMLQDLGSYSLYSPLCLIRETSLSFKVVDSIIIPTDVDSMSLFVAFTMDSHCRPFNTLTG
jgi:hypothetical protein